MWFSVFTCFLWIPLSFWLTRPILQIVFRKLTELISKDFHVALGAWRIKSFTLPTVALFSYILCNNFLGLIPYVFTASSHLVFSLALAAPIWVGHYLLAWVTTPQENFAHLVPLGTPSALVPFMVLIEVIRSLIRPLTLSVRLAANMIAGHLLFTLISSRGRLASVPLLSVILIAIFLLSILETAVRLIQAYVFRLLGTLYLSEVNSGSMVKH